MIWGFLVIAGLGVIELHRIANAIYHVIWRDYFADVLARKARNKWGK